MGSRFKIIGILTVLAVLASLPMALVIFEAPHRVHATLRDLAAVLGARRMLLARELTKVHEEVLRGTPEELLARLPERVRGEITLVVAGAPARSSRPAAAGAVAQAAAAAATPRSPETTAAGAGGTMGVPVEGGPPMSPEEFIRHLRSAGLSRRDAAQAAAVAYRLPARAAYRLAARTDDSDAPEGWREVE